MKSDPFSQYLRKAQGEMPKSVTLVALAKEQMTMGKLKFAWKIDNACGQWDQMENTIGRTLNCLYTMSLLPK